MAEMAEFLSIAGRRIAYRYLAGASPTIVFLPGYRSDMAGTKATAIFAWTRRHAKAGLLFDYSGCGLSEGDFAEGTLTRWRDEALALIAHLGIARVLLVGSSMGGWLMLRLAEALGAARVAGLVGIAAAPDFTEWGQTPAQKAALARGETVFDPNPYGAEPTPLHPGFWADARQHLLLARGVALPVPLRLVHGMADAEVPWEIAGRLAAAFHSPDVQLSLVKAGDHRFSQPADIALILREVAALHALG